MAGKIKIMIDQIIKHKSGGQALIGKMVCTKLLLKGIDPNKFSKDSPDDLVMIAKVSSVAKEMGVPLSV